MTNDKYASIPYSLPGSFDLSRYAPALKTFRAEHPVSFRRMCALARQLGLPPVGFALALEALERGLRTQTDVSPGTVWKLSHVKLFDVMRPSVYAGLAGRQATTFAQGDWGHRLSARPSILGAGWRAFAAGIAVQEYNAGMGLVAAAPTCGAAGVLPSVLVTVAEAIHADDDRQVEALWAAGLVGRVAFGRGPASGAQAGCGAEVGVAAAMAAAAAASLLGGGWEQLDAASALAATSFVGLECSPAYGLVEYPCIPRNGFAALCAVAAAEAACAGIVPPYDVDATFDRVFGVGRLLPDSLRETNDEHWVATPTMED